ncbi:MAG: hypothetical protein LJE97_13145 [Betaproteobacteria bacterium]|jgi:hypothetical protein|nr:hypothetical protein [Betaproteobacteria bacterium]
MRTTRLARLLSNCAAAALLLFTGVSGEAAVSWRYVETVDGVRSASTYAQGRTPGGQVSMRLEVRCQPGADATVSIVYVIRRAQTLPGFHFTAFEGPEAPSLQRKLATIRVVALRRDVSVSTPVAGHFLEDGSFAFTLTAPLLGRNEVKWLTDAMILGAVLVVVSVQDPIDRNKRVYAQFQASQAATPVANVMDGCIGLR